MAGAVHAVVAGHFSNIAYHIAARHFIRYSCRNENGLRMSNRSSNNRVLRGPWVRSVIFWRGLGSFRNLWRGLGSFRNLWRGLGSFRNLWRGLGSFRNLWRGLGSFRVIFGEAWVRFVIFGEAWVRFWVVIFLARLGFGFVIFGEAWVRFVIFWRGLGSFRNLLAERPISQDRSTKPV